MREAFVLELLQSLRTQLLEAADSVIPAQRETIPDGMNNHMHWQLGHVLTVTDGLIIQMAGLDSRIPDAYLGLFHSGTKPGEWDAEPPKWDELVQQLQEQLQFITSAIEGPAFNEKLRWSTNVSDNPLGAKSISELFAIWIAHESMHVGMFKAMAMTLQHNERL